MRSSDGDSGRGGVGTVMPYVPLAAAALAAVAGMYVAGVLCRPGGGMPAALLAGDGAAASAPVSGPASRPTWKRPRFTERQAERAAMARVIRAYGMRDEAVTAAMLAVPRHEFVTDDLARRAYDDTPLPIGYGQTISQPYIVAEMTRQLRLDANSRVLEIGTGSGYQAAVLTELTPHVWTMEIVKPLAEAAAARLKRLGYATVQVRHGDGFHGWADKGPFDGIIVTCAAGQVPPPLIRQLKPGGRMMIPVGGVYAVQSLMLVEKRADGTVRSRSLMDVRFVPLLRSDPTADR